MRTKPILSPAVGLKAVTHHAQADDVDTTRGLARLAERRELVPSVKALLQHYPGSLSGASVLLGMDIGSLTGVLALVLHDLGADVTVCPVTTNSPDTCIVAALRKKGVAMYGLANATDADVVLSAAQAISRASPTTGPRLFVDEGGGLLIALKEHPPAACMGGGGATCMAVTLSHAARDRAQHLRSGGMLPCPVMDVSASKIFDRFINPHSAEAILSIVKASRDDFSFGGCHAHVIGFGNVGKKAAVTLRSAGAIVTISEVSAFAAVDATTLGFQLAKFRHVAPTVDLMVTASGGTRDVVSVRDLRRLKCGAVVVNLSPNGQSELPVAQLRAKAVSVPIRHGVEHIHIGSDGWFIVLVSSGLAPPSACRDNATSASLRLGCVLIALIELASAPKGKYSSNIYCFPPTCETLVCRCHLGPLTEELTQDKK